MQNTISDPQWSKKNEFHSSSPGIFCWDIQPLETTNINNKDKTWYQLGTFFKVITPFNWTSFQNM